MTGQKNKSDANCSIKKIPVLLCPPEGARALLAEGRRLVCLIRHGQTDWNLELRLQGRESVPLNETGIRQAQACGELLARAEGRGLVITDIFTSPLSRARTTADIISEQLGGRLAVSEDCGLLERDYGPLSGLTLEERRQRFPKGEKQAKNVEKVFDSAARLKKCVYRLAEKNDSGALTLITHGGIINAFYLQITRGKIGTGKNICENCHISLLAAGKNTTIPLIYNFGGDMFLEYIEKLDLPSLPQRSKQS